MLTESRKIRIGLIVDSVIVPLYIKELIQWIGQNPQLEVTHLVHQQLPPERRHLSKKLVHLMRLGRWGKLFSGVAYTILNRIERQLLARGPKYQWYFTRSDIGARVPHHIHVTPKISKSGFVFRYPEDSISAIKNADLDLLIQCASGILKGHILTASRLGVVSFHHGDNQVNRGGPPGFWEAYYQSDYTGFTIQRLTEELDGGDVLIRGRYATKFLQLSNRIELYKKSAPHIRRIMESVANTGELPPIKDQKPYYNHLFAKPTVTQLLRYVGQSVVRGFGKIFRKYGLGLKNKWGVAFHRSPWERLVMWRAHRIPNPPNRFLADPFVISRRGKSYCFVEDYDDSVKRGCISVCQLYKKRGEYLGPVIIEPFHMSFPYLIEIEGALYMCPEVGKSGQIRLYRCTDFPMKWELSHVLMDNVSAADTMLVMHNGKWWMLTNIDTTGSGDHCGELFLFYSDSPFSSEWTPHPQNPIVVDAECARNGGLVTKGGVLYRVAQRQGFDQYGKGFSINKIVHLDEHRYEEKRVSSVDATFWPGLLGTHHLHSNGKITVFDYLSRQR
jgi:hypothetical protein